MLGALTCGANDGRTSRSATPQIDLRVWPGIESGRLNPGWEGWTRQEGCKRRRDRRGCSRTANFPLAAPTQINQLVNETSENGKDAGPREGRRQLTGCPMAPLPQQATELKEAEGEMKMSNSRRGEARIALRQPQSRGKRVCGWQRGRGHRSRGCLPNAVGQWRTWSQTPHADAPSMRIVARPMCSNCPAETMLLTVAKQFSRDMSTKRMRRSGPASG